MEAGFHGRGAAGARKTSTPIAHQAREISGDGIVSTGSGKLVGSTLGRRRETSAQRLINVSLQLVSNLIVWVREE